MRNPKPDLPPPVDNRNFHILMSASQTAINFCKSFLSMAILGYPTPTLIGWGYETAPGEEGFLGGGTHFVKITHALEYIKDEENRKKPGFEDDLVMVLDGYDIWFQLPFEVIVSRYDAIIAEENERVAHRMGRARDIENITSTIVFAAGKRCCPNSIHTAACYPVPDSPLPHDLYGTNTDSAVGGTAWSSFRNRYVNSGYVIGPVRDMRRLLQAASDKLDQCRHRTSVWFDGTDRGEVDHCYRGSDQSIYAEMFGEQEFHREVMRRRHRKHMDAILDTLIPNRAGSKPPRTNVQGYETDDLLNPPFSHQEMDPGYVPGKPYEYGLTLDYWSRIIHQGSNTWLDRRYIRQNKSFAEQLGAPSMFSCPDPKLPDLDDVPLGGVLDMMPGENWTTMPIYSEICMGVAPVMIHHNSIDKWQIERQWNHTWFFPRARELLQERRDQNLSMLVEGIPTDKGTTERWETLCPAEFDEELFRDGVIRPPPGELPFRDDEPVIPAEQRVVVNPPGQDEEPDINSPEGVANDPKTGQVDDEYDDVDRGNTHVP